MQNINILPLLSLHTHTGLKRISTIIFRPGDREWVLRSAKKHFPHWPTSALTNLERPSSPTDQRSDQGRDQVPPTPTADQLTPVWEQRCHHGETSLWRATNSFLVVDKVLLFSGIFPNGHLCKIGGLCLLSPKYRQAFVLSQTRYTNRGSLSLICFHHYHYDWVWVGKLT